MQPRRLQQQCQHVVAVDLGATDRLWARQLGVELPAPGRQVATSVGRSLPSLCCARECLIEEQHRGRRLRDLTAEKHGTTPEEPCLIQPLVSVISAEDEEQADG